MIKVKNVRPGILIVADAGLKLAPGETVTVEKLTPQTETAVEAGLLARVDTGPETRQRAKAGAKGGDTAGKGEETGAAPGGEAKTDDLTLKPSGGEKNGAE